MSGTYWIFNFLEQVVHSDNTLFVQYQNSRTVTFSSTL
jgi:hypothetical protein